MPQSLAEVLVHIVFSTRDRQPWIDDSWRAELHAYIGGVIRNTRGTLVTAGSIEDHIHLLVRVPRTVAFGDLVRAVKIASGNWIRKRISIAGGFRWQAGYAVFSVSTSLAPKVMRYIEGQRLHHAQQGFCDEYRRLLQVHSVEFDERYLWD